MVETVIKLPMKRSRYFLTAAYLSLAVVIIGFWKTFIVPSFKGTFVAPPVIYIHGALLFAWTLFLVLQSILIRRKNLKLHRKIGWAGPVLMMGVAVSTIVAGVYVLHRDIAAGGDHIAMSSFLGTVTTSIIFVALVTVGIMYRRRPEVHKRLMLLAMISIIWAAFGRFRHYFPPFEQAMLVFQVIVPLSMIVIAMLWEKFTKGRIHPVYFIVGVPLIAETITETLLFDTPVWQSVSRWIAGFFL